MDCGGRGQILSDTLHCKHPILTFHSFLPTGHCFHNKNEFIFPLQADLKELLPKCTSPYSPFYSPLSCFWWWSDYAVLWLGCAVLGRSWVWVLSCVFLSACFVSSSDNLRANLCNEVWPFHRINNVWVKCFWWVAGRSIVVFIHTVGCGRWAVGMSVVLLTLTWDYWDIVGWPGCDCVLFICGWLVCHDETWTTAYA